MKTAATILSLIALALTLVPPFLFLTGGLPGDDTDSYMKNLMMAGTVLWFATAPVWMRRED